MLAYIIIVGLISGSVYWTIRPLLREETCPLDYAPEQEDILQQLDFKKEETYATIRDLEFDLKMGKLSEEDFQVLKRQYMEEAVGYIREMDQLKSPQPPGEKRDVRKYEGDAGGRRSPEVTGKDIYCTSCGGRSSLKDRFCARCGLPLHVNWTDDGGDEEDRKEAEKC